MNINAKYFQADAFFIEETTRVIEKNSKFVELFFMFETRLFARNNKSNWREYKKIWINYFKKFWRK